MLTSENCNVNGSFQSVRRYGLDIGYQVNVRVTGANKKFSYRTAEIVRVSGHYAVQFHSTSLILVPYATSYY